jgi:hypothetical protein
MTAQVDGTPGSNDMPGRLIFSTTADGSASLTERMRISQNGFVNIGGQRTADESLVELNRSGSNTVGEGHIGFAGGADPLWAIRFDNSDFNFRLDRAYGGWTAAPSLSVRRSNGYVGLGVDTASYQLDVQNTATTFSRVLATNANTRAGYLAQAHTSGGADINMSLGVFGDATQGEISMATNHSLLLYTNNDPGNGVRVETSGNLNILSGDLVLANGHGIDFSATGNGNGTMSSELLDDYEEGTWTPSLKGANGNGGTTTYGSVPIGNYTKIGNLVTVTCVIYNTAHTGSGAAHVFGLPFACSSSSEAVGTYQVNTHSAAYASGITQVAAIIQGNNSHIHFRGYHTGTSTGPYYVPMQNFTYLRATITYQTDA